MKETVYVVFDRSLPCLRGLSIKYVDFLNISKLFYDNLMKICIHKVLFMFYFMVCNIRQYFN